MTCSWLWNDSTEILWNDGNFIANNDICATTSTGGGSKRKKRVSFAKIPQRRQKLLLNVFVNLPVKSDILIPLEIKTPLESVVLENLSYKIPIKSTIFENLEARITLGSVVRDIIETEINLKSGLGISNISIELMVESYITRGKIDDLAESLKKYLEEEYGRE